MLKVGRFAPKAQKYGLVYAHVEPGEIGLNLVPILLQILRMMHHHHLTCHVCCTLKATRQRAGVLVRIITLLLEIGKKGKPQSQLYKPIKFKTYFIVLCCSTWCFST